MSNDLTVSSASSGFVYVMSNKAMPGLLKIGYSARHPEERAKELQSTGVPYPFVVEFAIYSSDARNIENTCHVRLCEMRVSDLREFFAVDLTEAVRVISDCSVENFFLTTEDSELQLCIEDVATYAKMADVHPYIIKNLLTLITEDEWKRLAQKYESEQSFAFVKSEEVQS